MADYVCSKCGRPAASDARMGSLDVYLTCGCDRNARWINDGRGGYYETDANPVKVEDYRDSRGNDWRYDRR